MRHLACFAFMIVLASCNSAGLPNGVGAGGGGGGGGNGSDGGGGGGNSDLGSGALVDLANPNMGTDGTGVAGSKCQTACDCTPGLACRQGKCAMSMVGKVYCCEGLTCPGGSICQSMDGSVHQCGGGGGGPGGGGGGPGGGGGGGGGGSFCTMVPCQSSGGCMQLGCGSCDPATKTCQM